VPIGWSGLANNAYRLQIGEETIHSGLSGFKSHFLPGTGAGSC
jgi:hypothetical protein